VNVISRQGLLDACQSYPDAKNWVNAWLLVAKKAVWTGLADVRRTYPATDQVGQCLVFDVRGNKYRLIATVIWARKVVGSRPPKTINGTLYIKHFLTHAEYDKDAWKGCCYPS
jgi:mRNA interferase HigB